MARRGRALLAVAAALVAGCANDSIRQGADAPTTTVVRTTIPIPTTTLPDLTGSAGLAASIRQFREDEAVGRIQIELVRGLDRNPPTAVASVQLRWPGFVEVPPTAHDVTVVAGQRVDIPVPLGAVTGCDRSAPMTYELGTVAVVLADGRQLTAPLLADAQVALDNVFQKACMQDMVDRLVGFAYASPWVRSDPGGIPTASTDLIVTRRAGAGPIGVIGVDGSVLLTLSAGGELPATLADGDTTIRVPISVVGAGRCDGHALSDSKKTYDFQIQSRVDGTVMPGVNLPVAATDRPLLNQVIVDTCGSDHRR